MTDAPWVASTDASRAAHSVVRSAVRSVALLEQSWAVHLAGCWAGTKEVMWVARSAEYWVALKDASTAVLLAVTWADQMDSWLVVRLAERWAASMEQNLAVHSAEY